MRQILFKAKRIDTGEWIFGSHAYDKHSEGTRHSIVDYSDKDGCLDVDVDPETVCQFTGEEDHKEKRIFNGDELVSRNGADIHRKDFVFFKNGTYWIEDNTPLYDYLNQNDTNVELTGKNIHDKK